MGRSLRLLALAICATASAQQNATPPLIGSIKFQAFFEDIRDDGRENLRFFARLGPRMSVYFEDAAFILQFIDDVALEQNPAGDDYIDAETTRFTNVRFEFPGAAAEAKAVGELRLSGVVNRYVGSDRNGWRTATPTYEQVRLAGVYPGVDVVFRINSSGLKFDLELAAAADLAQIAIQVIGAEATASADRIRIASLASLEIPASWELDQNGTRSPTTVSFESPAPGVVGFSAADRNSGNRLIVDPIIFSTAFGSINETVAAVGVDAAGQITVCGITGSPSFPATVGTFDVSFNGGIDGFVAKWSPTGSLVWATYCGGSQADSFWGMALDAAGDGVVGGRSTSTNFPTTPGAYDVSHNGGEDAVVVKLSGVSGTMLWSTFIGGSGSETASEFAVSFSGDVYFGSSAPNGGFPTTPGAFMTTGGGSSAAVVFGKLSSSGASLLWSTYLGGSQDEVLRDLALDPAGDLVVCGSTGANFPTTPGAYDQVLNNGTTPWQDGFVAKLTGAGGTPIWSTYLGGTFDDEPAAMAVDAAGGVIVVGRTHSSDFPVTPGAWDTASSANSSFSDGYVARLDANGSTLTWSTFVGGSANDLVEYVACEGTSDVVVVVETTSSDLPTAWSGISTPFAGNLDVYVARILNDGSALGWSTYVGGGFDDNVFAGAAAPDGSYVVVGNSDGLFPHTSGAYQSTLLAAPFIFRIRNLHLELSQPFGPGSFRAAHRGGIPGSNVLLNLTFDPANGVGGPQGPWGGLYLPFPDVLTQFWAGLQAGSGLPFVTTLDASGQSDWTLPAGALPPGFPPLYGVTHSFGPAWAGLNDVSQVASVVLQ
jgi:hypothetical protein